MNDRKSSYTSSEVEILIASHRWHVQQCEVTIQKLRKRLKENVEPPVRKELERDLQCYETEKHRCEIFLNALTSPGPPRHKIPRSPARPGGERLRPPEIENASFGRMLPNMPLTTTERLELLAEGSNRLRFPQQPDQTDAELYRDALSTARLVGEDLHDLLKNSDFSVHALALKFLALRSFSFTNLKGLLIVKFKWSDRRVSLDQFCGGHSKGKYVVKMPGHVFVVIYGRVYDQYPERAKGRNIVGTWEIVIGSLPW
jgi:hypothetical protein